MADPQAVSAAGGDWLEEDMDSLDGVVPSLPDDDAPLEQTTPEAEPEVAPVVEVPPVEEEPAVEEPVAEVDDKKIPQNIPKKRFDQVNNRLKEAEKRLREFTEAQARQAQAQAAGEVVRDANWFDEREGAYMAAVIDGDKEAAKAIRGEIRSAEANAYKAMAETTATRKAEAVPAAQAVGEMVAALEAAFPVLDKTSDAFDSELVGDVLALQRTYLQNDSLISPAAALEKAAKRLGMSLDEETVEAPSPKPKAKPAALTDASAAIAAANAQPPALRSRSGYEDGEGAIDWDTFSEEDFDKLPLSKQKQLRGDGG